MSWGLGVKFRVGVVGVVVGRLGMEGRLGVVKKDEDGKNVLEGVKMFWRVKRC